MANLISIARPYAHAAFEIACDNAQQLAAWKAFLANAAMIATQQDVMRLLANPEIVSNELLQLFSGILGQTINQQQMNFLQLLAQNKRLILLSEINALFLTYCAAFEKMASVHITTAISLSEEFKQKFTQALTKRTQQQVTLHCAIDPTILGGAIIRIGDRVIDGSIRGKLTRLLEFSLR